jgi:hypothetical protein
MAGEQQLERANGETSVTPQETLGWKRLDKAAFGIIYGAVMVLSILMAAGDHPEAPVKTAVVLFGSVLAITLAKAFAELMAHALDSGERITRFAWRAAWRHSSPTLAVANLPTLFFLAAGAGWVSVELAGLLSQGVCVALLAVLGARVGWVIDGRISPAILGGLFAGGIGLALAVMKVAIH